jgi:thiol reductant ABC exporter CydC subunit
MSAPATTRGLGEVRALQALVPLPRRRLARAIALGTIASASGVALMAVSAWLISRAAQRPESLALTVPAACVQALAIGRAVFRYLERLASHDLAFRQLADLRVEVAKQVEPLAPAGLAAFRRGDLLSTLVSDVDAQQDLTLRVVEPLAVCALVGALAVVAAAVLLPTAGLVLAIALVVAAVSVPLLNRRVARVANDEVAARQAAVTALVVEALRAAPDLAVNGADGVWRDRIENADAAFDQATRRIGRANGIGVALSVALSGVAIWAVTVVAVPAVRSGALPGVELAALVLLPVAVWEVVTGIAPALSELDRVRGSASRLLRVFAAAPPVPDPVDPGTLPGDTNDVRLHDAGSQWPIAADAPDSERPHGIADVDLDLPSGRRIAVVGSSGAGKTTLVATLLRFVDLTAGDYDIDGTDVRTVDSAAVRDRIGHVTADAHVFDSTVRENLRFARPDADDDALRRALSAARLDTWVNGLPDGLDTRVGVRGAHMSAGERTRLSLARALLADRPVLLLDEPTAGLDATVADQVTDELLGPGERTVLLVTHRSGGLDQVDEVIELEEGRVVQREVRER